MLRPGWRLLLQACLTSGGVLNEVIGSGNGLGHSQDGKEANSQVPSSADEIRHMFTTLCHLSGNERVVITITSSTSNITNCGWSTSET